MKLGRKLISKHWYKKLTARSLDQDLDLCRVEQTRKFLIKLDEPFKYENPKQSKQTNKVDGYYERERERTGNCNLTRLDSQRGRELVQNVGHNVSIITICSWIFRIVALIRQWGKWSGR